LKAIDGAYSKAEALVKRPARRDRDLRAQSRMRYNGAEVL